MSRPPGLPGCVDNPQRLVDDVRLACTVYGMDISRTVLLTPQEAGQLFGVCYKTVGRWADAGEIQSTRTEGNHRRFVLGDLIDHARRTGRDDARFRELAVPLLQPKIFPAGTRQARS